MSNVWATMPYVQLSHKRFVNCIDNRQSQLFSEMSLRDVMELPIVPVSRFEFERIDLAITSLLGNQLVASESEHTRDQCQMCSHACPRRSNLVFRSCLASPDF